MIPCICYAECSVLLVHCCVVFYISSSVMLACDCLLALDDQISEVIILLHESHVNHHASQNESYRCSTITLPNSHLS